MVPNREAVHRKRDGALAADIEARLGRIAELFVERRPVAVLTGAGVSTASDIPDFRSAHGLWSRYPIEEYGTIQAFRAHPRKVWTMLWELARLVRDAKPNAAHLAIAELEALGVCDAVITQNIDGLHQKAGSKRVIELHGTIERLVCLNGCGQWPTREILGDRLEGPPPLCPRCGSVLKPDVTFFGEEVARGPLYAAFHQARYCGAMLVAGTSAVVAPASLLPAMAANLGAVIVEANMASTDLTPKVQEHIRGPNEKTLPRLVEAVRAALGRTFPAGVAGVPDRMGAERTDESNRVRKTETPERDVRPEDARGEGADSSSSSSRERG